MAKQQFNFDEPARCWILLCIPEWHAFDILSQVMVGWFSNDLAMTMRILFTYYSAFRLAYVLMSLQSEEISGRSGVHPFPVHSLWTLWISNWWLHLTSMRKHSRSHIRVNIILISYRNSKIHPRFRALHYRLSRVLSPHPNVLGFSTHQSVVFDHEFNNIGIG